MKRKYIKNVAVLSFIIFSLLNFNSIPSNAKSNEYTDEELKTAIEALYNHRNTAFTSGDFSLFDDDFELSKKQGLWAQEHEIKRVKYLRDWAKARGMKFTNVASTVRIKKVFTKYNPVKIALEETYKFGYIYAKDEIPVSNSFGVGIRHSLGLTKKDDRFIITHDWYTDCFEDALKAYNPNLSRDDAESEEVLPLNSRPRTADYIPSAGRYNRLKAAQYADKYCGAASGEGNNFKYNKKYNDFNGIGGDCTNFASQVLGDSEGGGLKQDKTWYCRLSKYGSGSGSSAWVNADSFKRYLTYSGKGVVIKKGTYKELALPQANFPNGAVDRLDLGDLVCYAKGSNMDHFAVVTGWDSHGYPLVNSHTTDRYHVPWDLGWGDKNIFFHLIHIK